MGHRYRASRLHLLLKQWNYAPVTAKDVPEPNSHVLRGRIPAERLDNHLAQPL